jgi:hypothetical protein
MSSIPIKSRVTEPIRGQMSGLIPPYVQDIRERGYYLPYIPTEYANLAGGSQEEVKIATRDSAIYHGLNTVSLQSAGDVINIICKDSRLKYLLEYMLESIGGFTRSRKSMIQTGSLFGLALQRKYYTKKNIPLTGTTWCMIDRMQEVDARRLRIERDVASKTNSCWTIWSPLHDAYMILEDKNSNPCAPEGFSLQDYCWYIYDYEETSPYFYGLMDILYPLVKIKSQIMRYWHSLCETWGEPPIIGEMDIMKATINETIDNQNLTIAQRKEALMKTLQNMRGAKVILVDKGENVRIAEHGSIGSNILKDFIEYIDNKILLVIQGAELTSKAGKSGSYALGSIHQEMTQGQVVYNREIMQDVIKKDIVQDFMIHNRQQLRAFHITTDYTEVGVKITSAREELKEELAENGIIEKKAGIKDI